MCKRFSPELLSFSPGTIFTALLANTAVQQCSLGTGVFFSSEVPLENVNIKRSPRTISFVFNVSRWKISATFVPTQLPPPSTSRYVLIRVSSKQLNIFFGSNRNKPKLNLFRLFFDLFHETKKKIFRFVSVCFGFSDQYRNNRNKQNFLKTNQKNLPKNVIY